MTTSLASKVLMSLFGAIAVGGTAVAGHKWFSKSGESPKSKKTIAKLIEETGKKILLTKKEDANGAEWKASWKKYREDNKTSEASKDPWTLSGFKGGYSSSVSDEQAPSDFQDKCISLSGEEVEGVEDSKYVQVDKWCTKDKG
ncbi:hypothetical protein HF1_11970 [Mycoplasma haemofelis str. Langford 1]|uniref:Uncharacterized protein n=1 Tax=Mycoplasma haemofelis (strain Langford 1) TaxID=941640 RepID=E8ZJ84_MYCHL|nr:hypothetical protein [Mycoplasma haemofelis]CBY93205.1 hypothetical protein HF1_11970 [Mycoplasma haemofelis str. Langford 1]